MAIDVSCIHSNLSEHDKDLSEFRIFSSMLYLILRHYSGDKDEIKTLLCREDSGFVIHLIKILGKSTSIPNILKKVRIIYLSR